MALNGYGVLKGRPTGFEAERGGDATPHFQITVDGGGREFRAAVNVKSKSAPSELVFYQDLRFEHPVTAALPWLSPGFHRLASEPGSGALDYIRGNLFPLAEVMALPHHRPGRDNDLSDFLESQILRAMRDPESALYVFGEPFPSGIHDVHMNQGNGPSFRRDDGVWQDGGLLVHFTDEDRWVALFLAFQSQALHTDDRDGHAVPGARRFADVVVRRPGREGAAAPVDQPVTSPPTGETAGETPETPTETPAGETARIEDGAVRIVGALVNPEGAENQPDHAGRRETVTLLNASPVPVALAGWSIADKAKHRMALPATATIAPGTTFVVTLDGAASLGNKGGLITLLDPGGFRIDGVSYTEAQARREGWTLVF